MNSAYSSESKYEISAEISAFSWFVRPNLPKKGMSGLNKKKKKKKLNNHWILDSRIRICKGSQHKVTVLAFRIKVVRKVFF